MAEWKIAFSGGASLLPYQEASVREITTEILTKFQSKLPPGVEVRVITGACVGVDAIVAEIAHGAGFYVHTFLPANRSKVDPYWNLHCTEHTEVGDGPEPYRLRNQAMVDAADSLIAFPCTPERWPGGTLSREGTWMTVRMADKANKIDRKACIFPLWNMPQQ